MEHIQTVSFNISKLPSSEIFLLIGIFILTLITALIVSSQHDWLYDCQNDFTRSVSNTQFYVQKVSEVEKELSSQKNLTALNFNYGVVSGITSVCYLPANTTPENFNRLCQNAEQIKMQIENQTVKQ